MTDKTFASQAGRAALDLAAQRHGNCGAVALHRDLSIAYMNPAACALLFPGQDSHAPEALIGQPLEACMQAPEARPLLEEQLEHGLKLIEFSISLPGEAAAERRFFVASHFHEGWLAVLFRETTAQHEAMESLNRSRERYERLRATVTDYVFTVLTADGKVTETIHGPSCLEITGYAAEDFKAESDLWIRMVPEEERAMVLEQSRSILAGDPVRPYVHRIIRKDGVLRWVRNTPVLYHDPQGNLIAYDGLIRDITPEREAEHQLRQSELRYRRICEAVTDYMYTVHVAFGRVVSSEHGPACEAVTGYTAAEFREDPFLWIRMVPHEDQQLVREQAEAILHQQNAFAVEHRIIRKDGRVRWVRNTPVLQFAPDGQCSGYDGLIRDITERKEADLALLKAHQSLEAIFNAAVPLCVVDHDGAILRANQAFADFLGIKSRPLQQIKYREIMGELAENPAQDPLAQLESGSRHVEREHTVYTPHRGDVPCLVVATPYEGEDAQGLGMVMSLLDLTERRRAEAEHQAWEEQRRKTQKLESLGVLAGGIAHDFNNLLMGILGNADLIRQELGDDSPATRFLDEIESTSKRAADLCGQMLAYSGRGRFQLVALDCNALVLEIISMSKESLSKNAAIRYAITPRHPYIKGDPSQIKQLLMNLVLNAAEAVAETSGSISIRTEVVWCDQEVLQSAWLDDGLSAGEYALFEVSDTGPGIAPDLFSRLFDPFFSTKFTGRGLGLPAVLGIVRGHQGAIKVDSVPGEGTTFRVYLPLLQEEASRAEKEAAPPVSASKALRKRCVLLVDDDESVLTVTRQLLEKMGYTVLLAASGVEAIALFDAHQEAIDVILMDITMPEMSGEEAVRAIRKICDEVPVLFSSGFDQEDISEAIHGLGRMGFVHKPYSMKLLKERIETLLQRHE